LETTYTISTPGYFNLVSSFATKIYLYIFVPIAILVAAYILLAYSVNMVMGKTEPQISQDVKFRRGVASFFPFLISLYLVMFCQGNEFAFLAKVPFQFLLIIGGIVGFIFIHWVSKINDSNETFAILSCLVSSSIFFTMLTSFVITKSFQVISFVFGLLFGICIYIIRYGFTGLARFKMPIPNFLKLHNIRRKADSTSKA
jgi:hypothetical protein